MDTQQLPQPQQHPRQQLDLTGIRARKARLAAKFGKTGPQLLHAGIGLFIILAAVLILAGPNKLAFVAGSLALVCFAISEWYRLDLKPLPAHGTDINDRLSGEVLGLLTPKSQLSP